LIAPFAVAVRHCRQLGTFKLRWMEALIAVSDGAPDAQAEAAQTA
jgi:hypothetical protein